MRFFSNSAFLLIAILFISAVSITAQESEAEVVDEVVAQVNESVITLSRIKGEMKGIVATLIQQGKTEAEAKAKVDSSMGLLIANLINEELLLQRGKEIGVEKSVEARINQDFLARIKEFKLKSLEELYAAMRQQGLDPEKVRSDWRRKYTQEEVWRNQVDSVTYWAITDKEIKDHYEKNKDKFKKPATATISEIFLGYAGRDKAAVKEKANKLVAQIRAGGDFVKLAMENSDRPDVAQTKGKVGTFNLPDQLAPVFAKGIEGVKAGGVADPIEIPDQGMEIIRVDTRTAASKESTFNEAAIRGVILQEKRPEARKKYIENLKSDAYIKIRKTYQAMVLPHLNATKDAEEKKTATVNK